MPNAEKLELFLKIAIQIAEILGGIHDANVIHKNCYYGLTINYQYVATLYKSNDFQLVSAYPFAQNLGYFGLGGFVMIDL